MAASGSDHSWGEENRSSNSSDASGLPDFFDDGDDDPPAPPPPDPEPQAEPAPPPPKALRYGYGIFDYDRAPSKRAAKCVVCDQTIAKGSYRWMIRPKIGKDNYFTKYAHAKCPTGTRALWVEQSVDYISGLNMAEVPEALEAGALLEHLQHLCRRRAASAPAAPAAPAGSSGGGAASSSGAG